MVTLSEQVTDGNRHSALAVELARLRAENARLLRLLNLTWQEAIPPGPWQSGLFEAPPGLVHADSPPQAKVALFGAPYGRSSPSRRVTTSAYCSAAADRTSLPRGRPPSRRLAPGSTSSTRSPGQWLVHPAAPRRLTLSLAS